MVAMMDSKKRIEELISSHLSGNLSGEEREKLVAWIGENPANHFYYQRLKNIWQATHPAFEVDTIDMTVSKDLVMRKIRFKAWHESRFVRYWQYMAAILLLPLIILSSYLYLSGRHPANVRISYQEVFAPYGTHSRLNLPDGSLVWLNAGSSLRYPTVFNFDKRLVELSGEAFFEVESDPDHPFVVQTDRVQVCAVGTAFNVEAYRNDSIVAVTMATGKVNVSLGNQQTFSLVSGERMGYNVNTSSCEVQRIDPYKWYAWKDGALVFRDDPLGYVFKKIGQTFNVDIILKDTDIADQLYRATFRQESLDEILRLLRLTAPIRYEYSSREVDADRHYKKQRIEVYKMR